ncbi:MULTISPECIES: Crp/Fnr family transcriptional regulator [Eubacteriales]|uniref:Cyclic nucleotide-binding domain-containing protein n=1 Tax=Bittarella massiliensis (ex Durand et al. 2017) TaxID=1720313 RepID=A0AAQ1MDF1_9FIRM|nr:MULTISPECIES: Crp/Fnr family transcriptional regulator [Eubacteriales]MZL69212.1 cyclic nucleotide-binding domain-containing protein [Bittarella massiliensis (ex Durand et al. 2017)]MZL79781.1 cyclic nucleotide-binding domain-containing protein [Bittarella massiliensis (ex Durand et al. 2017)]SHG15046.1 cAMP-binding domain of CRP or a regulatory subunit of cAMP-dependent protein kinases [Bittarella massiliensis (ex Durand et al. 2017)]
METPYEIMQRGGYLHRWKELALPAGTVLASVGEISTHVHYLIEGSVRILRPLPNGSNLAEEGLGPHIFIGDLGAMALRRSSIEIVTETPCLALKIGAGAFIGLLKSDAALTFWEAQYCAQSIDNYTQIVIRTFGRSVKDRFAEYLWELCGGQKKTVPFHKGEAADLLGSTVRTVNRYLQAFQSEGILLCTGQSINFLEPSLLRQYIQL